VEVLSPSNTPSQINRYARLGFEYGTQQFWSVDPETQTIPVRMPDGNEAEYRLGDSIPLPEFMGGGMLHVSDVFEVGA
jgi:Uma2 family endonuclease